MNTELNHLTGERWLAHLPNTTVICSEIILYAYPVYYDFLVYLILLKVLNDRCWVNVYWTALGFNFCSTLNGTCSLNMNLWPEFLLSFIFNSR